jgi:outer membrane protein assembly factor BamD (BamD/ComL family)
MERLVKANPSGELADRSSLLVGQAMNRQGKPLAARAVYENFANRFTNSTLLPELKLASAQTYEQEQDWPEALAAFSEWLAQFGAQESVSTSLVAQARFAQAWLSYRIAPTTNSVSLLSNFIERYPRDTNAPLVGYLVGEYYFSRGNYDQAELQFQSPLITASDVGRSSGVAYRSRLMAGRAAVARRSYHSAREHFDWVITNGPLYVANSPVPISVAAEAYILRGDTFLLEDRGSTNALEQFGQAITAFSKVAERFPQSELAPLAWGRIGDCQLQLASQDPKRYADAAAAYRRVMDSAAAIAIRSMATIGLGTVLEKQAKPLPVGERKLLLDQAMDAYLSVFYLKNLREGEEPDPFWVKRAGLAAADLAESQQDRAAAIGIYNRLAQELPPLKGRAEKRIAELQRLGGAAPGSN